MNGSTEQNEYKGPLGYISKAYRRGQQQAAQAINSGLRDTYWDIGRYIVEFEQHGAERAKYGVNYFRCWQKILSKKPDSVWPIGMVSLCRIVKIG